MVQLAIDLELVRGEHPIKMLLAEELTTELLVTRTDPCIRPTSSSGPAMTVGTELRSIGDLQIGAA